MKFKDGWSSLSFLISLMTLSILITGLFATIKIVNIPITKQKIAVENKKNIDEIFYTIVTDLKLDKTPQADSIYDTFYKWNDENYKGYKISIESLSGLININFFPLDVIKNTDLKNLITDIDTFYSLMLSKDELISNYNQISSFVSEENFDKYFTLFGWANYNISNEIAVTNLLKSKNIPEPFFISKRKQLLQTKQYVQNYTDYRMICGTNYKSIMPFINITPQLNVNSIDEDVLRAILSYPGFNIPNYNQKANNLINLRQSQEIDQTILRNALSITNNNPLYYLLGVESLFYRIEISNDNISCTYIIAKEIVDDISGSKKRNWYLMEKTFK